MRIGVDTTFLVEVSILEHPGHLASKEMMNNILSKGDVFVIAPQILTEFIHVVTDPRRFEKPLFIDDALEKSQMWWNAGEVEQVSPTDRTLKVFWEWMKKHRLGRKRILGTMLAATYYSHQVDTIISSNARDYVTFGCFNVLSP